MNETIGSTFSNGVALLFLDGTVYFLGLVLASITVFPLMRITKKLPLFLVRILAVFGFLLVILSATPTPYWVYALWSMVFIGAWAFSRKPRIDIVSGILLWALSAGMIALELPYRLPVSIPLEGRETLYVVGDSLSLGAKHPEKNWPELLGEKCGLKTNNLSVAGAKVDSALLNAKRINSDTALVILEIGGNNLLDDRGNYAEDLETLLKETCKGNRRVVMIELPLLPTFNRFGMIQRRLADQYKVSLIPKHVLARVLISAGATTDGLHLSSKGHHLLADSLATCFKIP